MGDGRVGVVVIAYNDPERLPHAVASVLGQGDAVAEVVVVDDASADHTGQVADELAALHPRVRALRRTANSGGCGTPRNDGLDALGTEWVMFVDSDDVLPPGAVDALLGAANTHGADVAAGLCVRRELPSGHETPWQPQLFETASVHDGVAARPGTLWDTLSVNKLYRRDLLTAHGIRFPDGAAHYEDFVFSARVYAHLTRLAVVPDPVYVWHVRRDAAERSISLRRDDVRNWQDRLDAHRQVLDIFADAGRPELATAAETKFADHDLRLYLRELPAREPAARAIWWADTRAHLARFGADGLAAARPSGRWAARIVAARREPVADLARLAELAAEPPRLTPPFAADDGVPVWDDADPPVPLDGFADLPDAELPLCAEAYEGPAADGRLTLWVADPYGRLAAAGPCTVELELRERRGREMRRTGALDAVPHTVRGVPGVRVEAPLRRRDLTGGPGAFVTWDLWARVTWADGTVAHTRVRAPKGRAEVREVVPDARRGVLLVQYYTTSSASLAIRVAGGLAGAREVLGARRARAAARGA